MWPLLLCDPRFLYSVSILIGLLRLLPPCPHVVKVLLLLPGLEGLPFQHIHLELLVLPLRLHTHLGQEQR